MKSRESCTRGGVMSARNHEKREMVHSKKPIKKLISQFEL